MGLLAALFSSKTKPPEIAGAPLIPSPGEPDKPRVVATSGTPGMSTRNVPSQPRAVSSASLQMPTPVLPRTITNRLTRPQATATLPAPRAHALPAPGGERNGEQVTLTVADILPRIAPELLNGTPADLSRELYFPLAPLAAELAKGRASIPLQDVVEQYPEIFRPQHALPIGASVVLPLQKLLQQISLETQPIFEISTRALCLPPQDPKPQVLPLETALATAEELTILDIEVEACSYVVSGASAASAESIAALDPALIEAAVSLHDSPELLPLRDEAPIAEEAPVTSPIVETPEPIESVVAEPQPAPATPVAPIVVIEAKAPPVVPPTLTPPPPPVAPSLKRSLMSFAGPTLASTREAAPTAPPVVPRFPFRPPPFNPKASKKTTQSLAIKVAPPSSPLLPSRNSTPTPDPKPSTQPRLFGANPLDRYYSAKTVPASYWTAAGTLLGVTGEATPSSIAEAIRRLPGAKAVLIAAPPHLSITGTWPASMKVDSGLTFARRLSPLLSVHRDSSLVQAQINLTTGVLSAFAIDSVLMCVLSEPGDAATQLQSKLAVVAKAIAHAQTSASQA